MTVQRPIEIELKYAVADRASGERVLESDVLAGFRAVGSPRPLQLEDRYLDSAAGALARAGFYARLRTSSAGTVVTVKSTGTVDGALQRREEIEGPAEPSAEPIAWPSSPARSLIVELCGDAPLVELVTIRQFRRRRDLVAAGDDGTGGAGGGVGGGSDDAAAVELSLDEVDVIARGRVVERFIELELELTRGVEADLAPLRTLLDGTAGLSPASGSKLERALGAARHAAPGKDAPRRPASAPIAVGKTPGVTADDLHAEAGRKVLRFHFARMIDREAGTREGSKPIELHAMRVSTRRMRAAWRVFGDGFRPERTRKFRRRLQRIATLLGGVRDLDVLAEATEAYAASVSDEERAGIQPLLAAWRGQRDAARVLLVHELDSGGHRRFMEAYRAFVLTPGAEALAVEPTIPHRVRDTAASRIMLAYEHVRAYESVLRWADVATLHELRIAAKRLRYTLEFVREALGPETPALLGRIVALQDHLGAMNDAEVGAIMARTFLVDRGAELTEAQTAAISRYLVSREREVLRLKRTVGAPWRGVAGLTFRRGLGRALAAL